MNDPAINPPDSSPTSNKNNFWQNYGIWCILGSVILGFVIIVVIVSKCTDSGRLDSNGDKIQQMLKETKHYLDLAKQDKDPLIALTHANYAWMTIRNLKDLFQEAELNRMDSPELIQQFLNQSEQLQKDLTKRFIQNIKW